MIDGTNGGNEWKNGTSNEYTSSCSGNNGDSSAPVGNPESASKTYYTPNIFLLILSTHSTWSVGYPLESIICVPSSSYLLI